MNQKSPDKKKPICPSPENPCMCDCHTRGTECWECRMGRHKEKKPNNLPSDVRNKVVKPNKTKELDKRVKLFIESWYIRTLECIDMDNGDRIIPPPTKKEWELGVKKDLDKLLTQQRSELLEEILEQNKDDMTGLYDYDGIAETVINLLNKKDVSR